MIQVVLILECSNKLGSWLREDPLDSLQVTQVRVIPSRPDFHCLLAASVEKQEPPMLSPMITKTSISPIDLHMKFRFCPIIGGSFVSYEAPKNRSRLVMIPPRHDLGLVHRLRLQGLGTSL